MDMTCFWSCLRLTTSPLPTSLGRLLRSFPAVPSRFTHTLASFIFKVTTSTIAAREVLAAATSKLRTQRQIQRHLRRFKIAFSESSRNHNGRLLLRLISHLGIARLGVPSCCLYLERSVSFSSSAFALSSNGCDGHSPIVTLPVCLAGPKRGLLVKTLAQPSAPFRRFLLGDAADEPLEVLVLALEQ